MASKVTAGSGRFPVVEGSKSDARRMAPSPAVQQSNANESGRGTESPEIGEMRTALLLAAYPLECNDSSWLIDTNSTALTELIGAADKYRAHLETLTHEEVATQFQSYTASERHGLFIEANCRRACRLPCWSPEEAAFYSFGLEFPGERGLGIISQDQELIDAEKSQNGRAGSKPMMAKTPPWLTFSAHLLDRLDLIRRAVRVKELPEPIQPGQLIRWAERRRIRLPYALISGAKSEAAEIEDWRDRYEAVQEFLAQRDRDHDKAQTNFLTENSDLKKEIFRLKRHIESLISSGHDPRLLRIDAQQNMQMMLICIARDKFGWDKSNDAAAKQISAATAAVIDGGLSTDTVKRRLKEAKEYVDSLKVR